MIRVLSETKTIEVGPFRDIPDFRTPLARWRAVLLVSFFSLFFVGAFAAYLTGISSYMVFSSLCVAAVTWYFGWQWSLLTGFLLHVVAGVVVGLMPRPAEVETAAGPWLLFPIVANELSIIFLVSRIRRVAEVNVWLQQELIQSSLLREKAIKEELHQTENAKKLKEKFFANMSHEIRTPISAINGFVDILIAQCSHKLTSQDLAHLQIIRNNSVHLLSVVHNILQHSKLESNKERIEWQDVAPRILVDEVGKTLAIMADTKRVQLAIRIDPDVPFTFSTDITKLRQILLNLASNSIKFTEHGTVRIHVRRESNSLLSFSVQDTGIGISQEKLDAVFLPFEQADAATTRLFGGTGLGLSICKQLSELLGGTLEVSSAVGVGSTFTVSLPLKDAVFSDEAISLDQTSAENESSPLEERTRSNLQGVRVLLAEDCVDNQKLISHILVLYGATVVVVNNGEELLEQLTEVSGDTRVLRESLRFDLVLTDIQMPLLDGYQVSKRLREIGFRSPIIAISANDSREDQNHCIASGFSDYIEKPIEIDQFLRACRRCIPHLDPVRSEIGSELKSDKILHSRIS
jgi:signal transduction histidine kinase/CheY-like chemotaxis protein